MDIYCFENRVDSDQLASKKPANQDQEPHCFTFSFVLPANNWNLASLQNQTREQFST